MKKIITAIGNQNINKQLKEQKNIEIIGNDIPYQEGVLEILINNPEINYLILSELLIGNFTIQQLIEKIKTINSKINIILILECSNKELENYLFAKGIFHIFYNNQIEIKDIIKLMEEQKLNENEKIQQELDNLKLLLSQTKSKNNTNQKVVKNDIPKNTNMHNAQLIGICGTSGVGKSIFTVQLAKTFAENNNKILIIDFDILNNSLHTILGIKKYSDKIKSKLKSNNLLQNLKIEELIIKINQNINLISGINLLFDSKYKISSIKVKNIFNELKNKYDVILIDTSSECFLDYTKEILKNTNSNIFLAEANLLEIKKAKQLLNIYINNWEIKKESISIIFNKYTQNSIEDNILNNIFSDFKIIGKIKLNQEYNQYINQNCIPVKKETIKISKKIIQLENKSKIINKINLFINNLKVNNNKKINQSY